MERKEIVKNQILGHFNIEVGKGREVEETKSNC